MKQFENPWRCPECLNVNVKHWRAVCTGDGHQFIEKEATGRLWWKKPAKVFSCELKVAPKHLHLECDRCRHRWMMLTASESGAAEQDAKRTAPPEPGRGRAR